MSRAVAGGSRRFCDDTVLNYASSRRIFKPGEALTFDEAYRLAHLPLVAPNHPAVIREVPDEDYRDGTYLKPRYSLVVPVASQALAASSAFRTMERALRSASFAEKIAWDLCERRATKLHATIMHRVPAADADRLAARVGQELARLGPLSLRLGGPFVGTKNTGRIYFPVYPQEVGGEDSLALIQDAVSAPRTRFYVVGYYNLIDQLNPAETADLAALIEKWRATTVAEVELSSMILHATNDDLALSGRPVAIADARAVRR